MRHLTATIRALTIFAATSLVGCDDLADPELENLDELEFRDGLPLAHIPSSWGGPTTLSFSVPLQPVDKVKPKMGFSLHDITNLTDYIPTVPPSGEDAWIMDLNGVSPYSPQNMLPDLSACNDLLESYETEVPVVVDGLGACATIETGCCDHVCYIWGGTALESNGQNVTVAVDHSTFEHEDGDLAMVYGSYVSDHMDWDMDDPNGGYSSRETVCGCACVLVIPD